MTENPILAIETTQTLCSACIYYNESKFYSMSLNLKHSHSEKIFDIIDSVVKSAEISINEIASIAFSSGPGSFTGLRIGLSAAKGIAFASGKPLIAVPTFEALAFQILHYLNDKTEFVIANKVNSDEVYYAKFQVYSNNFIFTENLQIINKNLLNLNEPGIKYFGNAVPGSKISAPDALFVAKYCSFASLPETYEYDTLEPFYIKNFIIKELNK